MSKGKEYLEKQGFNYDHFTKLTSTGISPDYDNIIQFAEAFANEQSQPLKDEIAELKEVIRKQKEVIESCQIG